MFKIANTPCSWGAIEGIDGERGGYGRVIDEMQETGYVGTELGDWGFMPTDPDALSHELGSRGLSLLASWVSVLLHDPSKHQASADDAVRTAQQLARVGGPAALIVLGNDPYGVPERSQFAGRITPAMGMTDDQWKVFAAGANTVARRPQPRLPAQHRAFDSRGGRMSITIKDIAKAAGVSHATVSRALHDHPAISIETIDKIKRLASKMGYVPNASARGLKTRRSRALGVIVSNIDDPFWSEVLQGIDEVLHPTGYSLFIAATHRDEQREKEVVQTMVQRGVEGVILCAPQFSQVQSQILQSYGLATAIVNNEGAAESRYLVFNDDIYGIRLLTRHLIDLGHTRIAYLGNRVGGRTTVEHEAGFREEMYAAGLEIDECCVVWAAEGNPPGGLQGAQQLLALSQPPTAILCYNDNMALGVYAALHGAGLSVPRDISVAGYDDIAMAQYLVPPLTTLRQFKHELGAEAANMMLRILETRSEAGELPEPQRLRVRGELIVRASTAPPRA